MDIENEIPEDTLQHREHQQAPDDAQRGTVRERDGEDEETEGERNKRSRIEWFEVFYQAQLNILAQKQKKEIIFRQLEEAMKQKYKAAIGKEISNNIQTGAYEVLNPEESERIRRTEGVNILQSRYVLVEKLIEAEEIEAARALGVLLREEGNLGYKAKARHVMKGFSEPDSEWLDAATPQVAPDSVLFVLQMLSSNSWEPGYLDFTQAFHSGDAIERTLFAELPPEGVPGCQPRQLLKLKKHCYGLLDGPYQWYKHLKRVLLELGYESSQADPCLFYLFDKNYDKNMEEATGQQAPVRKLLGIIGVATDDLLHGGSTEHWEKMQWIQDHYKLGKFSKGNGRFVGKEIEYDGVNIKVHQKQYIKDKIHQIPMAKQRKQQKFDTCTPSEVTEMRGLLGAMSWLAKETRPDIQGRVAMLQQTMPHPMVMHLLELNALAKEAQVENETAIWIQPIALEDLRIGVVTDASWGNSPGQTLEGDSKDFWEEQEEVWIRHHVQPRRILFHPGAAQGGPSLHGLSSRRTTVISGDGPLEGTWHKKEDFRAHGEDQWTGQTIFYKNRGSGKKNELNESFLQAGRVNSQGGHICFAYDKKLETDDVNLQPITLLSWKSYKLKRCTVNTLSAESQAMVQGVGSVHWMRFLLSEVHGFKPDLLRWEDQISRIPYEVVTDSKSLYDTLSKATNTASQVADKRTAIDLTILKEELQRGKGQTRWIPGTNMIADSLTKKMSGRFLRFVLSLSAWTLFEKGSETLQKMFNRG